MQNEATVYRGSSKHHLGEQDLRCAVPSVQNGAKPLALHQQLSLAQDLRIESSSSPSTLVALQSATRRNLPNEANVNLGHAAQRDAAEATREFEMQNEATGEKSVSGRPAESVLQNEATAEVTPPWCGGWLLKLNLCATWWHLFYGWPTNKRQVASLNWRLGCWRK